MGLFDFWRDPPTKISRDEIEPWLHYYHENEIAPIYANTHYEIKELIQEAKRKIDNLATADPLHNEIEERALQMLRDNKRVFVQQAKQFLHETDATKQPLEEFITEYETRLEQFGQNTEKNVAVLNQFLKTEVKAVASTLQSILDTATNAQDKLTTNNAERIQQLLTDVDGHKQLRQRKATLSERKSEVKEQIKTLQEERETARKRIDNIRSSDAYERKEALETTVEDKESAIEDVFEQVRTDLSVLKRGLKKYAHGGVHEQYVQECLSDPNAALQEKMNRLLQELRENLANIDVSDRTRDKIRTKLDEMGSDYVRKKHQVVNELREERDEAEQALAENTVQRELEQARQTVRAKEEKIEELRERLDEIEEEQDLLNIEDVQDEIVATVEKCFNVVIEDMEDGG